jgi:hypothetical protein
VVIYWVVILPNYLRVMCSFDKVRALKQECKASEKAGVPQGELPCVPYLK